LSADTILDQCALIVGGTYIRDGVYGGAGALAAGGRSVKFSFSRMPDDGSLGEDGIVAVAAWGSTEINPDGIAAGDLTVIQRQIRLQLLLSMTRSELPKALSILTPFEDALIDVFAGKLTLNGTVAVSSIQSIAGPLDAEPLYQNRMAIEARIKTVVKRSLAYAA